MSALEQAALSGKLTSLRLRQERDPDGREPRREPDDSPFADLVPIHDESDDDQFDAAQRARAADQRDGGGFLNPNPRAASPTGSQIMARGWSGNTGPKGVLLDFKASHGKSGAILGGGHTHTPSYPRMSLSSTLAPKRSVSITHRPSSSTSDSDSSDSTDRENDTRSTALCSSTKTTTRLILPDYQSSYRRRFTSSTLSISTPTSAANHNAKYDARGKKLFGHLREVGAENFIQAVEAEKDDKETVVLVHLYDPALESCLILNNHLSNLARLHPRTKFLRALASELDFFNENPSSTNSTARVGIPAIGTSPVQGFHDLHLMDDDDPFDEDPTRSSADGTSGHTREVRTCKATDSDILPTLVWYRSGEYVQSLPALERELPQGGIVRGEQGCKDLQNLLRRNGIITDPESGPL
ncbi:hypothetical protein PCANC_03026 [Puccinia coronata f. sp. avenae]|uniref:Phosducin thioredoxin-like domain-containing protein n=1 Tax=Puccinia coronata f. sp. avenae TaxID=200324 RepID=A0A2N5TB80_9BASI|nr:hypothetical protein PCANC_17926 [Puccinia coronata f. sp. avenae]PLW22764.1 hypothetical protein PCASD_14666 [Puccinia coronata f. sp. avenae]PLW42499.1 hypothetical protein PCASD_04631 [Puccinia coronata f. sp. avenae]PLW55954.1 hypothetical protein PCANC_03026 [Puccinia coronata f. sp. avenae]